MAALTVTTPLATASNVASTAVSCDGQILYLVANSDVQVSITLEVSHNGTDFKVYPLGYLKNASADFIEPYPIRFTTTWASGPIDVAGYNYFRIRFANASGGNAAISATYILMTK